MIVKEEPIDTPSFQKNKRAKVQLENSLKQQSKKLKLEYNLPNNTLVNTVPPQTKVESFGNQNKINAIYTKESVQNMEKPSVQKVRTQSAPPSFKTFPIIEIVQVPVVKEAIANEETSGRANAIFKAPLKRNVTKSQDRQENVNSLTEERKNNLTVKPFKAKPMPKYNFFVPKKQPSHKIEVKGKLAINKLF